ncbi:Sulfate transport system permease protein CysW [Planctomycetes bacterium MalM25]|nr:Sulfate transport system permease protein CysW [Planctomycetes bacterium MalM25]
MKPFDRRARSSDRLFSGVLLAVTAGYVLLILALIAADLFSTTRGGFAEAWASAEIRHALGLSLTTSTIAAVLSVWVATPIGYLMSRGDGSDSRASRRLLALVDAVLDIPIVLPPLVVGVSLLLLFRFPPFAWASEWVVYEVPAVILAQFTVACAFAVRTMRATFEQIPHRQEQVAMTLGANRAAAFWTVALPQARTGLLTAATVSWARAFGEFGPVLVFASSTRMRTEVLPTSVYLELQAGNLPAALAVSLMMIAVSVLVLVLMRLIGQPRLSA